MMPVFTKKGKKKKKLEMAKNSKMEDFTRIMVYQILLQQNFIAKAVGPTP